MSRLFYHVMQDNVGNLLFDVSGTMRIAGSGTLATIYGDEALTVILPNPMTNHPSFGSFKCFLGAGDYDFYMAKSGYTFETLTGVQGHGTMAQQDASNVTITGGTFSNVNLGVAQGFATTWGVGQGYATGGLQLEVTGVSRFNGATGMNGSATTNVALTVNFDKNNQSGQTWRQAANDAGPGQPVLLYNAGGTQIGSIGTTGSATAYNTSSDGRLKKDVDDLTGELALIQALRPVKFKWLVDDFPGVGFLANEVAQHVAGVITGEADAVDEAGGILPQQIDHSKLVPYLVGAVRSLIERVEALQARVEVLEDAAGV